MRKILSILVFGMLSIFILSGCISRTPHYVSLEKEKTLNIYTALEEEQFNEYVESFKLEYPDIDLNIIMDSHGVISAKLISEKDNPQADIVWGLSAINMIDIEKKNLLKPYASKNIEEVNKKFIDDKEIPSWVGLTVTETAIIVNYKELEKLNIPIPTSYEDLTKEEYKGLITMPNPASSGTGYFTVSGILQLMGEEKGFEYMTKLDKNIGMYTHSGSKPAKLASSGEYPIGISFGYRGVTQMNNGDPVKVIFPKEGSGWDLESIALVNKKNIKPESEIFMEWALSNDVMKLYSNNAAITSIDTGVEPPKGYPKDPINQLIDNDLVWASDNRLEILKQWEKRYGSKTEKK